MIMLIIIIMPINISSPTYRPHDWRVVHIHPRLLLLIIRQPHPAVDPVRDTCAQELQHRAPLVRRVESCHGPACGLAGRHTVQPRHDRLAAEKVELVVRGGHKHVADDRGGRDGGGGGPLLAYVLGAEVRVETTLLCCSEGTPVDQQLPQPGIEGWVLDDTPAAAAVPRVCPTYEVSGCARG